MGRIGHREREPLDPKESRKRQRERLAIALLSILFVALTFFEFKLTEVSTSLPLVNSIFFFGLLNINIIVLVAVIWLIARNVGKLYFERRNKVLGSQLKTKLVVAFALFSTTPTLVLFLISSFYINSSFDKWFSIRVQNTLQGSIEITKTYYQNAERTSKHFAVHLAKQLGNRIARRPEDMSHVQPYLASQRELMALNAVEFYQDPFAKRMLAEAVSIHGRDTQLSRAYPRLAVDLLDRAFSGEDLSIIQHIGTGDLVRTIVPVYKTLPSKKNQEPLGVLAVSSYIPVSLVDKVGEISSVFKDYKTTNPLQYPIKTAYFVILIMITLVIIFVAIWLGLYLAKELTDPVQRLMKGAQQVGSGNLDFTVESVGQDELSHLVDSFNLMTSQLRSNREQLNQAASDLEKRTLQLEAVLANVGTGVIVIDLSGQILRLNRSAEKLLSLDQQESIGKKYSTVLDGEARPIRELIQKSIDTSRAGQKLPTEVAQLSFHTGEESRSLAGIATALEDDQGTWGIVVVIDDMTHLIKAQREVAWREVARRIAHEIKNPLTPIKLSAQRLQRRLGGTGGRDGELLQTCTETIIKHTDELKEMVNEFSNFARLPEISPASNDLNEAIEELIRLFSQAHPKITFKVNLEKRLHEFFFDRDQVKRVIMNLLDNGVAALRNERSPVIQIATHFNEQLKMAVIKIEDNGRGMSESVRSRVFEPYFSTKKEGTGLGLAIAKRIVNDHDGFIRVQSRVGEGTQFWIELPTAANKDWARLKDEIDSHENQIHV